MILVHTGWYLASLYSPAVLSWGHLPRIPVDILESCLCREWEFYIYTGGWMKEGDCWNLDWYFPQKQIKQFSVKGKILQLICSSFFLKEWCELGLFLLTKPLGYERRLLLIINQPAWQTMLHCMWYYTSAWFLLLTCLITIKGRKIGKKQT